MSALPPAPGSTASGPSAAGHSAAGPSAASTTASPAASGPARAGHRRLVAAMLVVVSLAAIGLVTLGAAADRGPGAVYRGDTEGEYRWLPQREPYSEPDWSTADVTTRPPDPDGTHTGVIVALIALGVVLLIAVVWVALRMRQLARPAPALADLAEEELTVVQARAAVQEARARLAALGDPHDAVIAAWLALERAVAAAGVRRDPAQTTLEYVVTVLGAQPVDRTALERLSHLYRRALFDPAPLDEDARDEALGHLERLSDELAAAPAQEGRR
ncbi:DUF4129 domain-containing protein [Brachybacterium saurashtrense]|uniref:DUF4129 domain-containing protein n=1 Tax=Brachybacterium saurashtrense TaxID=556288 RepID=A0A345YKH2_9MICO|nr:DUF4129 domain-containing protein [Brachybacterium saurashtrense]AXK44424.1 DUF4129 domain-containing protein [Brachybacterium saurashtrense]RRR23036.1 DUF4129 domain-containing protein [Brachybacterium saurashtrense]